MLRNFKLTEGLSSLNTVAGWLLITAIVILTVVIAVGIVRVAAGKSFGVPGQAVQGMSNTVLGIIGAIVLGSIGGFVQYSTTDAWTKDMLPKAAQPKEITIDRKAPRSKCVKFVSQQSKGYGPRNGGSQQDTPSDSDHQKLKDLVNALHAGDLKATKAWSKAANGQKEMFGAKTKTWNNGWEKIFDDPKYKLTKVTWLPDGTGQDCSAKNKKVAQGEDSVTIEIFVDRGFHDGHGQSAGRSKSYYDVYQLAGPKK